MTFKRTQVEKGIRQVGRQPGSPGLRRTGSSLRPQRFVSRSMPQEIADSRKLRARLTTEVAQGKHGETSGTLGALLDEWPATAARLGRSRTTIAENRRTFLQRRDPNAHPAAPRRPPIAGRRGPRPGFLQARQSGHPERVRAAEARARPRRRPPHNPTASSPRLTTLTWRGVERVRSEPENGPRSLL